MSLEAEAKGKTDEPKPRERTRILKNAASMLLGQAGGDVLATYAVGLAAVSLGPAGFGALSEAQAFMDPFDIAAAFGLAPVTINLAAQRNGCDDTLRGTAFAVRSMFSLLAIVLATLAAWVTGRSALLPILAVISVGVAASPIGAWAVLPFQFNRTMHRLILLPFIAGIVRLGTAYLALHFLNTAVGFQASASAAIVVGCALHWVVARREYPGGLTIDWTLARSLVKLAWPAAALELVVTLYMRGSYFLLHREGAHAQGEFAAADRLIRPIFGVASALFLSALPTLATMAARRDFRGLSRSYVASATRLVAIAIPVAGAFWVLMPWLLLRFLPEYGGATAPFRWLIVGAIFMLLNQLSSSFVIAMGRFRTILGIALVNFAVYFALASHLVPAYKATGAAMATTVMEGINTAMQLVMVYVLLRSAQRSNPDRAGA